MEQHYNLPVINRIKDILTERKETLAVAESVTSGHLQAAISLAEMASGFFQGGLTTYNLNQKTRHLHVDPIHAMSCNCVSKQVAEQMATHTHELFKSDWALAITGYATPMPDLGIDDLFAFYAVSFRGEVKKIELIRATKDHPLKVQRFYANAVLESFATILNE
jgi:nicotinamide-nucleotide amidase